MRDRLIELLLNSDPLHERDLDDDLADGEIETIADHLIANGVIVPPCKVGQTVYVISQMRDKRILPFINTYEVTSIEIGKKKCVVYHKMDGYIKIIKQDDFGKTVFLTREEAEKALADRSEG